VALARLRGLRTVAALIALAVLGWIGYQTVHAGGDVPPPPSANLTRLTGGRASDKRIDGKSWSLDYDAATMSQDGTTAEIDDVKDGIIMRNGKPYMHVRARHVSANTLSNSFTVTGPVSFAEIGGHGRTLVTKDAIYTGQTHTLVLPNRVTLREGSLHLIVDKATIDFSSGTSSFGRIVGTM
jgi:hypothetical protein